MADQCLFPGCSRFAQKNGYCIGHRIYSNAPVEKSVPKSIPKRSEKMKDTMKEYKPAVKAYLAKPENKACNIQSPVCTFNATCVNHIKRRGKNLLNQEDWEASCAPCNLYIEENTAWAQQEGHLIPVHHKVKQQS